MGLWSKLKGLFTNKKNVAKEIEKKNEENSVINQQKFDAGLKKSSDSLSNSINNIAKKYQKIDEAMLEEIEEALLLFDIGPKSTQKIIDAIVEEIKFQRVEDPNLIK